MATSRFRYLPRRRDRAVEDDSWLTRFLERAPVGVLATLDAGEPFVNSNLFVYRAEQRALYLHTARRGHTRDQADTPRSATFHAFVMGRLLPAGRALDYSVEYASATLYGRLCSVEHEAEAFRALGALMAKYAPQFTPGRDYEAATEQDLLRTSVMRLDVERWSGKRNARADAEGAYPYPLAAADLLGDPLG
jgi:hypothetical protein